MSNKTIHELDSLSEIAQNDEMLIYDISAGADNPTKKTTAGNLLNFVKENTKDVYSTDEVKTNKVWIDGKPIYRKVLNIGEAGNGTSVNHNLNMETMISYFGKCNLRGHGGMTYYWTIPYFNNEKDTTGKIAIGGISSNSFSLISSWDLSNTVIWVEYTKTTD